MGFEPLAVVHGYRICKRHEGALFRTTGSSDIQYGRGGILTEQFWGIRRRGPSIATLER